mgnify:CR=1 FL=1
MEKKTDKSKTDNEIKAWVFAVLLITIIQIIPGIFYFRYKEHWSWTASIVVSIVFGVIFGLIIRNYLSDN